MVPRTVKEVVFLAGASLVACHAHSLRRTALATAQVLLQRRRTLAIALHHHLHHSLMVRPSRHPATLSSVWMCRLIPLPMGTAFGCGSAMAERVSFGSSTTGRSALLLMSPNALIQGTCPMEHNCISGIVMDPPSSRGVLMVTSPPCICPTPARVWTTMVTGHLMGNLSTFGNVPEIGISNGQFGTKASPHFLSECVVPVRSTGGFSVSI